MPNLLDAYRLDAHYALKWAFVWGYDGMHAVATYHTFEAARWYRRAYNVK